MLSLILLCLLLSIGCAIFRNRREKHRDETHPRNAPLSQNLIDEAIRTSREHLAVGRGLVEIRLILMKELSPRAEQALSVIGDLTESDERVSEAMRMLAEVLPAEFDTEQQRWLNEVVSSVRTIRELKSRQFRITEIEQAEQQHLREVLDRFVESLRGTGLHLELNLPQILVALIVDSPRECRETISKISRFAVEFGNFGSLFTACSFLTHRGGDLLE